MQTGSDVRYFIADHLGSTNALTDSSGNVTSSASYDSFGNATGNLATRYRFTGREYDDFTGLHCRAAAVARPLTQAVLTR
ncbi:MAG: RHS domain-containing protein [Acidobacteria bacterium]|nr:RHS domain-containing protein [Acidobacteriota bacterium]